MPSAGLAWGESTLDRVTGYDAGVDVDATVCGGVLGSGLVFASTLVIAIGEVVVVSGSRGGD